MKLEEIIEEIQKDPRNENYTKRGIPPIIQVNKQAKILIIGQAPGRKVEETLIPFNDQSGVTLRKWLGIDEKTFYSKQIAIMPMDFYFPGKGKSGDLAPRKFMAAYHKQIRKLMPNIQLTILIGKYAIDYYLKKEKYSTLTQTVRHYAQYFPEYFPIVHPSPLNYGWRKKNPWFEKEVVPALQDKVHEILEQKSHCDMEF
ncbi:hypothetical protein C815_01563 [Firmicutes bacterium M10-2]|nr:hypothetical protein C815_01563 [Firmicutes bacterium M10-2]